MQCRGGGRRVSVSASFDLQTIPGEQRTEWPVINLSNGDGR